MTNVIEKIQWLDDLKLLDTISAVAISNVKYSKSVKYKDKIIGHNLYPGYSVESLLSFTNEDHFILRERYLEELKEVWSHKQLTT